MPGGVTVSGSVRQIFSGGKQIYTFRGLGTQGVTLKIGLIQEQRHLLRRSIVLPTITKKLTRRPTIGEKAQFLQTLIGRPRALRLQQFPILTVVLNRAASKKQIPISR
jgi:hypothetical protein